MPVGSRIALPGLLLLGLAACDDKQAQNNAPTKPDAAKTGPRTDQRHRIHRSARRRPDRPRSHARTVDARISGEPEGGLAG